MARREPRRRPRRPLRQVPIRRARRSRHRPTTRRQPHRVYSEPFESRVELAQASFGKEHWAHKSGRAGSFLWPTIARIGPEAARLAGYRQLAAARWVAAPLYVLDFADDKARDVVYNQGAVLRVRLERMRGAKAERFRVAAIEVEGGRSVPRTSVALKLNTLASIGFDQDSYWLDSGSVLR